MVAADKPGHGVWPGHSGSRWRPDSGRDTVTVTVNLKIRVNLRFSQDDWQLRLERPCCAGRRVATHGGADSLPREGRRVRVGGRSTSGGPAGGPPRPGGPRGRPGAPQAAGAGWAAGVDLAGPPGSSRLQVGGKHSSTTVELEIQLYKRVGCVWPPAFARQTPARSCIVWTSHPLAPGPVLSSSLSGLPVLRLVSRRPGGATVAPPRHADIVTLRRHAGGLTASEPRLQLEV